MAKPRLGSCCYCRRGLDKPTARSTTAVTRDHVMPRSVGGCRTVRCCRQCNQLKGDIHPSVWRWFTEQHAGWWRKFRTNAEVAAVCRVQFGARVSVAVVGRARRDTFLNKTELATGAVE